MPPFGLKMPPLEKPRREGGAFATPWSKKHEVPWEGVRRYLKFWGDLASRVKGGVVKFRREATLRDAMTCG